MTIRTYSPILAWVLSTFAGCRIRSKYRRPQFGVGALTIYRTSWVLEPVRTR